MTKKQNGGCEELRKIAKAASRDAIRKAIEYKIPFAVQEGKNIVKIFPDGKKEIIGQVDKAFVRISKKKYKMA